MDLLRRVRLVRQVNIVIAAHTGVSHAQPELILLVVRQVVHLVRRVIPLFIGREQVLQIVSLVGLVRMALRGLMEEHTVQIAPKGPIHLLPEQPVLPLVRLVRPVLLLTLLVQKI